MPAQADTAKRKTRRAAARKTKLPFADDQITQVPVQQFAEQAYLNYSMYVILDRALPFLGDGLKPVQRRIIYAMSELGLKAPSKPKKSARTVGDVIGKFHPHGDSACYEAMVLMAQSFSFRYPLIEGQGNWGSHDAPKSFAAMRYTESRLTPYCDTLLAELDQGTVEWQANFDGALQEPRQFPARLPNILLNGSTGIAVGMATDIPPHNLREVAAACDALLQNSRLSEDELLKIIRAPDYPTGGEIITPPEEIRRIYKDGGGMITLRATYAKEKDQIIITALPYRVSAAKVLTEIAEEMKRNKSLEIRYLRDESDGDNPVRLALGTKRATDADALMSHLFATTNLEQNCRINFNIIDLDGKPKVMGIAQILKQWIAFRTDTVEKRLRWRLRKIQERLEILRGFLIAHLHIDAVIEIIRHRDKPKPVLMKRLGLSEKQADAILAMRLRQLAKVEEIEIRRETETLEGELAEIEKLLSSPRRLRTLIRSELKTDAKNCGDARRCRVVGGGKARKARLIRPHIEAHPVTVVLSRKSWIFGFKTHEADEGALNYRIGDGFASLARGQSDQNVFFLDAAGRGYCLPAADLEFGAKQGEPLSSRLTPSGKADFASVMMGADDSKWALANTAGYGFVTELGNLATRARGGKQVMSLPAGADALAAAPVARSKDALVVAITSAGHVLAVKARALAELAKGKGTKIINIPRAPDDAERLSYLLCVEPGATLVLAAGKRKKKFAYKDVLEYAGERGRRGRKLPPKWRGADAAYVVSAKAAT